MKELRYKHEVAVHNTKAAEITVPEILKLVQAKSALDVGCGIGTWLHVLSKNGVKDIMGIDGDYVDRELLFKYISADQFKAVDLEKSFDLGRKFDLAISLEVAEHLNEASADTFIDSICRHADTIIFSAAIPGQGGQNHINEQWATYWMDKFKRNNYKVYDPFRAVFWNNQDIDPWYRQNMLLFSKNTFDLPKPDLIDVVLPDFWNQKIVRIESLQNQIARIRSGKVGIGFYLKGLIRSILLFGRKIK